MKIRFGFVSNSSTSSYVVMGVKYDSEEELRKIAYVLLGIEPPEKPFLTLQEKECAVRDYWKTLDELPVEYYKHKCGELEDSEFEGLYEQMLENSDDSKEMELWELMDDLYESEWVAETEYENVIGLQIARVDSDGDVNSIKLDFEEMKEKVKLIEEISGKKAEIFGYVTGC